MSRGVFQTKGVLASSAGEKVQGSTGRSMNRVIAYGNFVLVMFVLPAVLLICGAGVVTTVQVAANGKFNYVEVGFIWLVISIVAKLTLEQFWESLTLIGVMELKRTGASKELLKKTEVYGNVSFGFWFVVIRIFVLFFTTMLSLLAISLVIPGMKALGFV